VGSSKWGVKCIVDELSPRKESGRYECKKNQGEETGGPGAEKEENFGLAEANGRRAKTSPGGKLTLVKVCGQGRMIRDIEGKAIQRGTRFGDKRRASVGDII